MAVKATAEITLRDQTDAEALILWHYVSTSATKPNKPNTTSASATPSGWSKSEPSVSSDSDLSKYDYTSLQIVWGDGTCDWGDVNLSASYEAAKRAWNKAGSVENQLNNLEIGGRNLAKASDAVATPTTYNALDIYLSEPFEAEQTYVFQLWDVDVSHSAKSTAQLGVDVYYCGGTIKMSGWHGATYFTNGHADHLQLTLTPHESAKTDATGGSETTANSISGASSTTNKYIRLYNSVPSVSGTMNLTVGKWKLEKGNKATDWTPAPEDVTYDINTVSTAASEANEGLADSIAEVSKSLEEANTRITNLTNAVADADADRAKWVQVDSENGITIGAVDSSYNLVLDNNSVDFMVGDQLAATASIDAFIPTALRLGDYVLSGSGGYLYIDYQPLQTQ